MKEEKIIEQGRDNPKAEKKEEEAMEECVIGGTSRRNAWWPTNAGNSPSASATVV
jgi:hypothetical protein